MKKDIHPQFNTGVVVSCACGAKFTTGSTASKISLEICNACHPFFTGTQKLIDTEGRVDKFAKRQALAAQVKATRKDKEEKKKVDERSPKTLKEMLDTATKEQ
jgi:large subunit ribosomal protein L31